MIVGLSVVGFLPVVIIYAVHQLLRLLLKRGHLWFLCWYDLLACPLVVLSWMVLEMFFASSGGKSLSNLAVETLYPCWAWCGFVLIRSVLDLRGVEINTKKCSLIGCVVLVLIVVLAYAFVPSLPE